MNSINMPSSKFDYPISFWLKDIGPVEITEYIGCGKFRGFNEFGEWRLYSWEQLKSCDFMENGIREKANA